MNDLETMNTLMKLGGNSLLIVFGGLAIRWFLVREEQHAKAAANREERLLALTEKGITELRDAVEKNGCRAPDVGRSHIMADVRSDGVHKEAHA